MIVKESKQTRYGGLELELIQAAMWYFEEAQQAWEDKHPNKPMRIQEMIIEKAYFEEENVVYIKGEPELEEDISIRLDVDVIGLKYILGIFVAKADIHPWGYSFAYMVGHEHGETEVEFKHLVSELEKTIED